MRPRDRGESDPLERSGKECGPHRQRLDDRAVNIANLVRHLGGGGKVITLAAGGLLAISGIAVAISLASCESSSHRSAGKLAGPKSASPATPGKLPDLPASAAAAVSSGEPQMRVRILPAIEGVKIGATGGVVIGQGDPKGAAALPVGSKTEQRGGPSGVCVALKGGQWLVCDIAAGVASIEHPTCVTYSASSSLVIKAATDGQPLAVNSGVYPGTIRLAARSDLKDGQFEAVEFVGVEDYLPGVVAKEMLTGWPLGAYQAQAVAARTYALQERERSINAGLGFDVESSDKDQVYAGSTTNLNAKEAVRSTRGVVLKDGERLLRAYFSSTCGGRTAAAKDTWPIRAGFEYNLAGPIQEHPRDAACTVSPLYRWTVDRPKDELVRRIRLFGERSGFAVRKLGDLQAIEPMGYNANGRPNRYKIIEPGGAWYQLSAEELRLACNASGVGPANSDPSVSSPPLPDITRATRVNSGDFEVTVRGDRVIISGRGFGHGVGLCQYCAKAFAERGEDWRTMIERFYPGARIVNLY